MSTRGRTVGDAVAIGEQAEALVEAAYANGPLTVQTAAELRRHGHHDALVGQAETQWMDVKGKPYFSTPQDNLHFASDVASFANAGGGLIALGLKTTVRHGDEIIAAAKGILLKVFDVTGHRNLLRDWIYPRLVDVRIEAVPSSDDPEHGIVLIEIPKQPLASHPFLSGRQTSPARFAASTSRSRSGPETPPHTGTSPSCTPLSSLARLHWASLPPRR